MAVSSKNKISDSDDSASDSDQVRKKSEHPSTVKQFLLVDPKIIWYPIHRRKSNTGNNFRLDFFQFLNNYMINHRDLLLPDNTTILKWIK
jgi:hypothetical protein